MFLAMFVVFIVMLVTVALAGLVVAYVAYVDRGRDIPDAVPHADRLTDFLVRIADRWRVPTEPAEHRDPDHQLHVQHGGIRRHAER